MRVGRQSERSSVLAGKRERLGCVAAAVGFVVGYSDGRGFEKRFH